MGSVTSSTLGRLGHQSRIRGLVILLLILGLVAGIPAAIASAAPPSQEVAGNADNGKDLFTGGARFENGGPNCLACHSISGIGALGGGALGPDLTGSFTKLGAGVAVWPESVVPMQAIFTEKPLTDSEKADLTAFLQSSSDLVQRTSTAIYQLLGIAILGTAIVLGIAQLIWRRRLRGVRRAMVPKRVVPGGYQ